MRLWPAMPLRRLHIAANRSRDPLAQANISALKASTPWSASLWTRRCSIGPGATHAGAGAAIQFVRGCDDSLDCPELSRGLRLLPVDREREQHVAAHPAPLRIP